MPLKFRFEVSHARFCVIFATVLYVACNAPNLGALARWFRSGESTDWLALSAFLFAGLCLFVAVFTLVAHRFVIKPLAILLTVLSCTATYFIAKYAVAIDSSMIRNTLHTDPTEVRQLLSTQMIPYIVLLIVLPAAIIVPLKITFRPGGRYLLQSLMLFVASFILALLALYSQYNAILRAGNVSNKYIVYSLVPINIISGSINVASRAMKPWFRRSQAEIQVDARVESPGNLVVVLAVGESSRKKSFSLYGYTRRNTNPVLEKVEGLTLLDGIATRASTLYALPKILEQDRVKLTTITSKAGIHTTCLVNYTLYDNCEAVGEKKSQNCRHGGKCYDEDVIPLLAEELRQYQGGYRFVVLHLGGGSHGPMYAERHPPEFQKFTPMCTDADVANKCTLEELYNSYDNTILYVDHVLGAAIDTLESSRAPYVFIYLSDHGESLMEDGMMFHGVPPGVSLPPEQAEIPLIVKSSVPVSIVPRAQYQQWDVFDSVLDLLSIRAVGFDRAGSFIKKSAAEAE